MEERFTYDWLNRLTDVIENGGPLGVFTVLDSHIQPMGKGMYYVHPDHLGSWTTGLYTPNGACLHIPDAGSYVVTFTLPNGDEYYGEFEVTE